MSLRGRYLSKAMLCMLRRCSAESPIKQQPMVVHARDLGSWAAKPYPLLWPRGHTNSSALDFLRFQPVTNIERRTLRA